MTHPSAPTDADLLAAAYAGDRSAEDALIHRHAGLVGAAVKQSRYPSSVDRDDLEQVGRIALLGAIRAKSFDPARVKFTTYAATCIRRAIWKHISHDCQKSREYVGSVDSHTNEAVIPNRPELEPLNPSDLARLDPLMRDLVNRAAEGESRNAAARRLGIRPAVARKWLHSAAKAIGVDVPPLSTLEPCQ
jgi:RNA polymerase sigma factor (sigma-70 family)